MDVNSKNDFVALMVPSRHYEQMVSELSRLLVAEQDSNRDTADNDSDGGSVTIERNGKKATYDKQMLATIKAGALTRPTVRALFEMTAEQPGQLIPLSAIRERASVTPEQARAQLSGFSQFVKRRLHAALWPFDVMWINGSNGNPGTMAYSMPPAMAHMWRNLA